MTRSSQISAAFALIWAGVAIGGSLIATPAKFQAPSLSLPVALEVGRAQFFWVGVGEWILCAALVVTSLVFRSGHRLLWIAPVLIFLAQRLLLMPALDARTMDVIAGQAVGDSNLHVIYIGVEVAKIVALLVTGLAVLALANRPEKNPAVLNSGNTGA